jgi:hypothetical protein
LTAACFAHEEDQTGTEETNAREPTAAKEHPIAAREWKTMPTALFCSRRENLGSTLCWENRDKARRQQKTKEKRICARHKLKKTDLDATRYDFFTSSRIEEQPCSKKRNNLKIDVGKKNREHGWEIGPGAELSARPEQRKSLALLDPIGNETRDPVRESKTEAGAAQLRNPKQGTKTGERHKLAREPRWTHKTKKIDFFLVIQ